MRYYETGVAAAEQGDWEQVEKMMRRAIGEQPEAKRRRMLRKVNYFPHYYLGLARYNQGDCEGALTSWAESERQGAIIGLPEYMELSQLQDDCKDNGKPTRRASRQAQPQPQPQTQARAGDTDSGGGSGSAGGSGGSGGSQEETGQRKKTGKEKVRTGQHVVEKSAKPTSKVLGVVGKVAPEGSDLGKAASDGQKAVEVAEAATDIVDLVLDVSKNLEMAVNSYFSGNPQRVLQLLQEADMSDPRARAQVYLFRAAANFRLHLTEGKKAFLSAARTNADLFQNEQWRKDFPAELFDPRFVRFLRGGS